MPIRIDAVGSKYSPTAAMPLRSVRGLCRAIALTLLVAGVSYSALAEPPQGKCQAAMGGPQEAELGCVGRIGLMRLSKDFIGGPVDLRAASRLLFGQENLPEAGAEIKIRRSAHLREWYDEARDEQIFSREDAFRYAPTFCTGWCEIEPRVAMCFGAFPSKNDIDMASDCPGATDQTQYFGIHTKVKVLGYQQMGNLFVRVQILEPDSKDPVASEVFYEFDRSEVF